ncbi:MAG TPA: succinate dehydrogenase, partial [Planctomycetota bacterium]|nr:succinate dehydrogenase [Planctomycetota bacterium]
MDSVAAVERGGRVTVGHGAVLGDLWGSTVGRKALVAASGLLLWGWVVAHLLGNLIMFSGAEAAGGVAVGLRRVPGGLWAVRVALAAATVVH